MSRCKGCGSEYRKGVLVSLLAPDGLTGARVCQSCATRGVVLVAPKLAPVVKTQRLRPEGVDRALRMLRTFAHQAQNAVAANPAGGTEAAFHNGRAEGFEGAIECIKRECAS